MSSEDEQLARRLQSAEFIEASRPDRPIPSQQNNGGVAPVPSTQTFSLSPGRAATVKLHNVSTNRQIGEVVLAHYIDQNVMAFELASARGRFLKAKDSGLLDYAPGIDETAKFRVEAAVGGNVIYLAVKSHDHTVNRIGGVGWYLGLSSQGHLYCDGGKDLNSQWALVSAGPSGQSSIAGAVTNPLLAATPQLPESQTNHAARPPAFPGVDAGRDELLRFFLTSQGEAFLANPSYSEARHLYHQGLLQSILHRPDWPLLSLSYTNPCRAVPYDETIALKVAFQSMKEFFDQGYLIVRQVASPERIQAAKKIVNFWSYRYMTRQGGNAVSKGKHFTAELLGDVSHDPDLLHLYTMSPFPHILQRIMGKDEVEIVKNCRVMQVYPCLDVSLESPALLGDRWNIEGFTKEGGHSPYNVLIGVALTDMTSTDMGNFCVHPGSHIKLMDQYREQAANKQTLFSEDPVMVKKVDLGEPVQLKLRAGDGFMCTQRLATLMAHNTTSDVASFAFFRVSHVDHAVMKEPALQSMWVEYQHASQFLESSPDLLNSGWEEVAPAVAVPTDEETQFIQKDSSAPEEL